MPSQHSSHWNIHKRDESRQTLAVLSPKPRNGCSHFKRPSILLAQDCRVCERPAKTSECSSPRGRGKDSLPEWVRAGPCCLPHRTRQASSSPNFDRSLRWFVVLLALPSHFLVARATRNGRYSCPVQHYWLLACTAAAHSPCMHAHNSSSIERRPQVRFSDSFMNLDSWVEDGFFFLFGVWIRRIGPLFFPSPTRFWPDKYAYNAWQQPTPIVDLTHHCPQEPCRASFSQSTSALNSQ